MTEPFDAHDARTRRIAARLLRAQKEPHMPRFTKDVNVSDVMEMLETALQEWQPVCPGAGWEHHNAVALATLAQTPTMQELLRLALIGYAIEQQKSMRATKDDATPLDDSDVALVWGRVPIEKD